jgi:oligopeptide transport system substrate-binding protein
MLDEMPIIPSYWYVHFYLARPELKGMNPSVMEHRSYKTLDLE